MYDSFTFALTPAGKRRFGTRKQTIRVIVTDKPVELNGGYWDGGSRSEYWGMLKSGTRVTLQYPTAPPQFGGGAPGSVMPTDDMAVIRGGVFCGKESGLTVYVNKLDGWMRSIDGIEKVRI